MTPGEALEEIASLLELDQAPTHRVRAFRRAQQVVAEAGDAALGALAAAGRLTSLPGIGASTGRVVAQALAGEVPTYLADLRERDRPQPEGGRALRAALRGDCHSHTTWSDGGSSVEEMARAARRLGHEYLVVTDHSPHLTVAHGLSPERLVAQWAEIVRVQALLDEEDDGAGEDAALAGDGATGRRPAFRLLRGIEVDILEDGTLDQEPELLAQLDVVVGSVHSRLRAPSAVMTERLLTALADPHLDVLGHCTGRRVVDPVRPPSVFDAEAVLAACVAHDVAVEVNSRPERKDPPRALLRQAVAAGCTFTVDTDAHAPGQLGWQWVGTERAQECGVPAGRVLNTLGADALLGRLAARGAR